MNDSNLATMPTKRKRREVVTVTPNGRNDKNNQPFEIDKDDLGVIDDIVKAQNDSSSTKIQRDLFLNRKMMGTSEDEDHRVTSLTIPYCIDVSNLSKSILQLDALRSLSFHSNTSIPPWIGELDHLEKMKFRLPDNPDERDAATGALKALLKGRDGTPFRRGQKSAVPASVRVAIDRICGVVEEAALGYYNHDAIIGAISMKHNKSGGGQFADAAEYAQAVVKRNRNTLSKMYKEGTWDGSLDSLLSTSSEE